MHYQLQRDEISDDLKFCIYLNGSVLQFLFVTCLVHNAKKKNYTKKINKKSVMISYSTLPPRETCKQLQREP